MFCTDCGNQLGGATVCPNCGKAGMVDDMPLLCACGFGFHALSGEFCPDCNRANPFKAICDMCDRIVLADMDYCANCGTRLGSAMPELPVIPPPVQQNNDPDMNRAVCFCVNFIALALLLAGGFIIYIGLFGYETHEYVHIAVGAVCALLAINWIVHQIRS